MATLCVCICVCPKYKDEFVVVLVILKCYKLHGKGKKCRQIKCVIISVKNEYSANGDGAVQHNTCHTYSLNAHSYCTILFMHTVMDQYVTWAHH